MNLAVLHVRAQKLAQDALVGVTDKVGKPIYEHCQRVASKFPMSAERIVAILHEIVEDSDVTLADLSVEHEFPEEIVRAVEAITHVKGEDYPDYIVRVSRNKYATGVLYHPLGLVEVYTEKNLLSLKTIVRGRLYVQYFNKNFTRMGIHTKASRFINEVVGMSESEPCPHIPKSFEEAIRKCVVKKPLVYWKYQLQKVSKRTGEVLAYKRYMNEGFLRRYGSAIRESYEGSGEVIYNSATKEWERFEVEVELFRWDRAKPEKVPHEEMLRLTTL